jgi:hypothetical protein
MKNIKKTDLFIVSFLAILAHSLILGFTMAGIGAMAVVLTLIGFNNYLEMKLNKEEVEPLKAQLAVLQEEVKTIKTVTIQKTVSDMTKGLSEAVIRIDNTKKLTNAFNK